MKKCKYCIGVNEDVYGNKTGRYIDGSGRNKGMCFFISNGIYFLKSSSIGSNSEIKVNYCPICGRKLGVDEISDI